MRTLLILSLAAGLSACATHQQRMDALGNDAKAQCSAIGYAENSPEWRDCVKQLFSQTYDADQRRRQAGVEQMQRSLNTLVQPAPAVPAPPTAVVCRQTYYGLVCQ